MITITRLLLSELKQEMENTRKMLALVPYDHFSWKPHEKSMSLQSLSIHLAEIPEWVWLAIETEGIDFAAGYTPSVVSNSADLMALFEKKLQGGVSSLEKTNDEFILNQTWTMRKGDHVIMALSKYDTIRHAIAQNIHHRAQLGVYLRLLNIPIPGVYGPSADDSTGF